MCDLENHGVGLFRGLLSPSLARRIRDQFLVNLSTCGNLFPNYRRDANRNVFSLAMAFSENDPTLYARMAAALQSGHFQNADYITDAELSRLSEIADRIFALGLTGFQLAKPTNQYVRYERARRNSAYGSYFIHQDGGLGLNPRGLTVWIALSHCGRWAPSLQFIPRKYDAEIAGHAPNLPASMFSETDFVRPIFHPGDAVIFDAWTVHGTWIHRLMPFTRVSLDVRLIPTH